MTTTNDNISKQIASKIIGIQFSILSPEEIRKGSVAEITNRDTYVNNKPIIGGLFDPRLGVLEPGLICPTDGLDYIQTPGYFGHINLARPVFYIQYLNVIIKILRCVCIKCSKLLISKDKYKEFIDLLADNRWNKIFSIASKIKRCGECTDNGCGYKQPAKIKKENLATLIAEWDNVEGVSPEESNKISIKLTPEKVIKIFRRISDDDIAFMGFSPLWSRPDWMVCQVLAIPPPAVRPSIKHDSQQRSEDDITHIIVNIIKANKTLQEKIAQNADGGIIDDWTTVLQYYIATLVDNKIPGVAAVAQRSGRPLKSIKERLNGKSGRVRGNLMGKRVDYSARSVITPDPQLSIRELGVPLKIAKNLTKPVIVNDKNKNYLLKLVRNGPDIYPGAKILEKKNGENISLRYIDKESIKLQNGDKVHRHMLNGDNILFNRQPTLHKMSMMSHVTKIMPEGDTFRMNVGDTKPYNADFDGDEMNLHLPQDDESEIELAMLAAIPYQIISPANNKSIIGIFQDSLLGCYLFTNNKKKLDMRFAMNLLMGINKVDINKLLKSGDEVTNFDIISQILPPISLEYKTKRFNDDETYATSNNVLDIKNGKYLRGHIEKGILGDGSKGLIQRINNDYGNVASADFIDNIQNVVTEYMKYNSYSVGISDLISDDATDTAIYDVILEKKKNVQNLIDETHLGIFENKTGKSNEQEFETKVNNILNQASLEAGKIGRSSLDKDNRFVIMVNAGSKGSDLNIAQMISCLGQQNVDGKRIPYGYENRTLPHYNKFDDSPSARGFIENSFIGGLTPTELFFHAMGGRVGLIDTAVKTSQTGYISRRLIKSLEDLMVHYDMTVRNNKNKIIQFSYGDDCFDPIKVEFQTIPLVQMSFEDIYNYFQISYNVKDSATLDIFTKETQKKYKQQKSALNEKNKFYIDYMKLEKVRIIDHVFKKLHNKQVHLPVAFSYIIANIVGQFELNMNSQVDISPLEAYQMIEETYEYLESYSYIKPNSLFKVLYYFYLTPKQLLIIKRFNKKALTYLLDTIVKQYKQAIVNPGEMVGIIAAQSIGEPTTQLTLNSVTYDTDIIVRNRDGIIKKVKIGEFTEQNINISNEKEYYEDKDTTYAELNDFYEIPSATEDGEITWNLIEAVTQHPVVNEDGTNTLIRVTTEHGRDVTATKAKSFLQLREGKIVGIDGKDLKVGDYLPVSRKPIDFTEVNILNLKEIFLPNEYLYTSEIMKAKKVMHEYHWWSKHNDKTFIVPYNRSDSLVKKVSDRCRKGCKTTWEFQEGCVYPFPHTGTSKSTIPEEIDLDYDFGYLMGAYCAEGCVTKTQVSIANIEPGYFDPIERLCRKYNITTKIYRHENKGKEGWTSQDLRIYSVMMTRIVEKFGGKLSHGKFVHDRIIFSNKECLKGFLDAYIGGDGTICKKGKNISIYSVSKNLIWDVHQILNILDIYSFVRIPKKRDTPVVFPTYTTPVENIKQGYQLNVTNCQAHRLASILNIKIQRKQDMLQHILTHKYKYEYCKNDLTVPNIIDDKLIMEPRNGRYQNIYFDKIKSIEEVHNPTKYVFDLTVEKTRNFNIYNGINLRDTFHFAGVASKSNVTRGVPRIEEILALSDNPKNPSCTIYLPKEIEHDQHAAQNLIHTVEHTKLNDIIKTISICFDPDDLNTLIETDEVIIREYKEFSEILNECIENTNADEKQKSKWIIRMEMNETEMLDKNITMEDIHFALKYTYQNDVTCIYSDYNSDNLIFRIRLKNVIQNKKKAQQTFTLDQSDEIYILKNFQEELLNNLILRGVKNISNVLLRKISDSLEETDGNYNKKEIWVLDTVGSNLLKLLALDNIDTNNTVTNHIQEIYRVLGIEAARQSIYNELVEVIEFDSTYINYHHLSILCDRMTCNATMVSVFRHGINNDNIGPIAKASFEETPEQFLKAARHAELDNMRGVSANVMCGQDGYFGTSSFNVLLDINEMIKNEETEKLEIKNDQELIEKEFGDILDPNDPCSINNIAMPTNIANIKSIDLGEDDDYDPF